MHQPSHAQLRVAEDIYQTRRRRDAFFDAGKLFGEPAYDIMLDLFIAGHRGADVSVSSACIAAGVPMTTALRYIEALQRRGWVERRADPHDGRRHHLTLTGEGFRLMNEWLAIVTSAGRPAPQVQRGEAPAITCTAMRDGERVLISAGSAASVKTGFSLSLAAARELQRQLDRALTE